MLKLKRNFYCFNNISSAVICAALFTVCTSTNNSYAAVVSRGNSIVSSRPTVSTRNETTGRMPVTTDTSTQTTQSEQVAEEQEEQIEEETTPAVENKSSQFGSILSESGASTSDTSADNLAAMIQQQRAELDAQDAINTASNAVKIGNGNACDSGLRSCMQEKCGTDFTKCSGDTDTLLGDKMDSCRLRLDCTGEEYRLFSAEIKADMETNAQLASYNAILNCGNEYNDCIMTECGVTFGKCLGKTAGDAAIEKCKKIATNCVQQDSGLASRAMKVFANLRLDAEEQVQKDEERLYELRDQMSQQCTRLGAMFDERTFNCVFTVNFYAGEDSTLYASKKLYAGNVFNCTPDWFGIDVTTFMENAYRLTRDQTSASASLMGSGLGVAAGAITSGAIGRAIDRQKAENALKDAKEEAKTSEQSDEKASDADKKDTKKDTEEEVKTDDKSTKEEKSDNGRPSQEELKKSCEETGGTWKNNFCSEPECGEGEIYDDFTGKCKKDTSIPSDERESRCKIAGGVWSSINLKCTCSNGGTFNNTTGMCECASNQKLENGKCVLDLKTDISGGINTGSTSNNLFNTTNTSNNLFNSTTTGLSTRSVSTRGVSSR